MFFLAEIFRQLRMKYRIDTIIYNVVDLFKRTKKSQIFNNNQKTFKYIEKKTKHLLLSLKSIFFLLNFYSYYIYICINKKK